MNIEKNSYLQNFVVTCAGGIGFYIAFLSFGLNISQSFSDFLSWLSLSFILILFIIILKIIFRWVDISDLIAGFWTGIVLYCWSPILTLPWLYNFVDSLIGATSYFLIGLIIFFIGYLCTKRK